MQRGARDVCACARVRGRRRGDKRRAGGDGPEGGVRESRDQDGGGGSDGAWPLTMLLRSCEKGEAREAVQERQHQVAGAACRLRFLSGRLLWFLSLSGSMCAGSLVSRLSKVKGITCGLFQAHSIAHDERRGCLRSRKRPDI